MQDGEHGLNWDGKDLGQAEIVFPWPAELSNYPSAALRNSAQHFRASLLKRLFSSPGIVVVTDAPLLAATLEESQARYRQFLDPMGILLRQSKAGEEIFLVADESNLSPAVRGSKTAMRLPFHTDGAPYYFDEAPDISALLVFEAAESGGAHRAASVERVLHILATEYPDLIQCLTSPVPFDRSFERLEGSPVSWGPILTKAPRLSFRYNEHYIRGGYRQAGISVPDELVKCFIAIDEICERPDLAVRIDVTPGMLILENNRALMHSRDAYRDSVNSIQRRKLLRAWVAVPEHEK